MNFQIGEQYWFTYTVYASKPEQRHYRCKVIDIDKKNDVIILEMRQLDNSILFNIETHSLSRIKDGQIRLEKISKLEQIIS